MPPIDPVSNANSNATLLAQNAGFGSRSEPPVNGAYGQSPTQRLYPGYNVPGAIKAGLNLIDLARFDIDTNSALQQAKASLQDKPEGSAVVIEQSFTTAGDANFRITHYNGTYSTSFRDANAANDYVNGPKVTRPGDSTAYTIVVKSSPNSDPAIFGERHAPIITTDQIR